MDVNYNLISLIDTLGLFQGIILGSILILINRKKDKSTLFLGIFIFAYALELLPDILDSLNITEKYPQLILLPFDFTWLLFPLFYVYVQEISILPKSRKIYNSLIPGVIVFIFSALLFLLNTEIKIYINNSLWYNLVYAIGIFYSLFIGFKTYIFIKKHTKELSNQYTFTTFKELRWAKWYLLFGIIFTFTTIISSFFEENFYFELIISIINVVLLYWISLRGILQQNIKQLIPENNTDFKILENYKKVNAPIENNHEEIELFNKIEAYLTDEKPYLRNDLTIVDISKKINEHPKRVSYIINSISKQNFKSYINSFRVEEAKHLLKSKISNNLSIEGIGTQVGFQSKSTFYEAFKKDTNTTPLRFKNEL